MDVQIVNRSHHALPEYKTLDSAGMDLRAFIEKPITLSPGQRTLVPTGLHIALPPGYEAQVRPRSGLAYKSGVTVLNTPGTVDADYRGDIGVILINLSDTEFVVEDGDRIAQLIIAPYTRVEWTYVDQLDETARGEGGFGSTGKH